MPQGYSAHVDSHWEKCIYQLNSRCLIEHDYDYSKLFLLLAPLLLLLFFVVVLITAPLTVPLLYIYLQSGGKIAWWELSSSASYLITLYLGWCANAHVARYFYISFQQFNINNCILFKQIWGFFGLFGGGDKSSQSVRATREIKANRTMWSREPFS